MRLRFVDELAVPERGKLTAIRVDLRTRRH